MKTIRSMPILVMIGGLLLLTLARDSMHATEQPTLAVILQHLNFEGKLMDPIWLRKLSPLSIQGARSWNGMPAPMLTSLRSERPNGFFTDDRISVYETHRGYTHSPSLHIRESRTRSVMGI